SGRGRPCFHYVLNDLPRVLGAVFARLVELAAERGHVKRRALNVGDDPVVVAVPVRALQLGDARLDARDRGLHLGVALQRAEAARVVGDANGADLGQSQTAEVVNVHGDTLGVLAAGLRAQEAEVPQLGRQALAEAIARAD